MYGWIQETIEALVLEKFGSEAWQKVKLEAGLASFPTGGFARNEYYNDAITMNLVRALCNVCKLDMESALVLFWGIFHLMVNGSRLREHAEEPGFEHV